MNIWLGDRAISQIPQRTCTISTIYHFGTEMCTFRFQSGVLWGIRTGALWDLWDWSKRIYLWTLMAPAQIRQKLTSVDNFSNLQCTLVTYFNNWATNYFSLELTSFTDLFQTLIYPFWEHITTCISVQNLCFPVSYHYFSLSFGQNGNHFTDDILKCIFMNAKFCISIQISLKFVLKGPINNKSILVQVMAWRQTSIKPLPALMLTQFTDAYMGN